MLFALLSVACFADPPDSRRSEPADLDRAADLFASGARLYDEGNYDAAIAAFREALELSGRAELHFNIANCHERLGALEEAYNELNLYRATAPPAEQQTVDRRLQSLRLRIAQQRAVPVPVPLPLPPPAPVPRGHPEVHPDLEAWTLLGAGGAVGVGSIVSLGFSGAAVARHRDDVDKSALTWSRVWSGASWVGLFGGAGLALGGVLASDVTLVAGPGPGGPAVGVAARF